MFKPSDLDKETDFVKSIFTKLFKDLDSNVSDVDFTNRREKIKFLKRVKEIFRDGGVEFQSQLLSKIDENYKEAVQEAKDLLDNAELPTEGSFRVPSKKVVDFLLSIEGLKETVQDEVQQSFSYAFVDFSTRINLIEKEVKNKILSEIGSSSILGKARDEIALEIQKILEQSKVTGFSYLNKNNKNINISLEAYSKSLTQQSIISGRAIGTTQEAVSRGHDLLQVSKHSDQSPMCQPYSGQVVSITGSNPDYKSLEEITFKGKYVKGGGIFHRNCRHSLNIYIPTNIKFNDAGELADE